MDKVPYKYIELSNIDSTGSITGYTIDIGKQLPSKARRTVKTGDVLVSSLEESFSSCAIITKEHNDVLRFTGFYVINSKEINSSVLLPLFKPALMQSILK